MRSNLPFLIPAGVMILYGLFRLLRILIILRKKAASTSWPSITGKICDCEIKEQTGLSSGGRYGHLTKVYKPVITYCYSVMGENFANKVTLGNENLRSSAEDTVQRMAEYTPEIRYNPKKPKEHICWAEDITKKVVLESAGFLLLGLLFLLFEINGFPAIFSGHSNMK